ncbi:hypothetical protein MMC07_006907 [Pseudocyphellaria aurata]|nr:hypothetical protein [Pseudocyphellaria aurata]
MVSLRGLTSSSPCKTIVYDLTARCGLEWSSIAFQSQKPRVCRHRYQGTNGLCIRSLMALSSTFSNVEAQLLETLHRYTAGPGLEILRGSVESAINQGQQASVLNNLSRKPLNGYARVCDATIEISNNVFIWRLMLTG